MRLRAGSSMFLKLYPSLEDFLDVRKVARTPWSLKNTALYYESTLKHIPERIPKSYSNKFTLQVL